MKKYFHKLIIVIVMLAIILPIFPVGQVKAADEAGLYGYKCRKMIMRALEMRTEIPEWKRLALLDKLSVDGYFWMKTKAEKLRYFRNNLANNQYLSVVEYTENLWDWPGPENDNNYDFLLFEEAERNRQLFMERTIEFHSTWIRTCMEVFKYTNRMAIVKKVDYSEAYFDKRSWRSAGQLDVLYGFWPDLLANKNEFRFTEEEISRLYAAYNIINNDDVNVGVASIIAKMPAERGIRSWRVETIKYGAWYDLGSGYEMTVYVNDEVRWHARLTQDDIGLMVASGGVQGSLEGFWIWFRAAGGKLIKPIASGINRGLATSGGRAVKKTFVYVEKFVVSFADDLEVDIARIFRGVSVKLTKAQMKQKTNVLVQVLNAFDHDEIYHQYLGTEISKRIIKKSSFETSHFFKTTLGLCDADACAVGKRHSSEAATNIFYKEYLLYMPDDYLRAVTIHENFHIAQVDDLVSGSVFYSPSLELNPLSEAAIEWNTRFFRQRNYLGASPNGAYDALFGVWDELVITLKFARNNTFYDAAKVQAGAVFKDGIFSLESFLSRGITPDMRDLRGITSAMGHLNDLLKAGKNTEAENFLMELRLKFIELNRG